MGKMDQKELARTLFDVGVRAANPDLAVRNALKTEPLEEIKGGTLYIVAVGKAACPMMEAALDLSRTRPSIEAIAVTNYENHRDIPGCRVLAAGHPSPDENGLAAGQAVMETLRSAVPNDVVLCLISGGGSALLPAPKPGLSLKDKIKVNDLML